MTVYELKIGSEESKLFFNKEDAIDSVKKYYGSFWKSKNLLQGSIVGIEDSIVYTPVGKCKKVGAYIKAKEVK